MKHTTSPTYKLCNHLRHFRQAIEISQYTLAFKVGITRSNLCQIERGKVVPSLLTAFRLADFFEVTIEELFSLEETKTQSKEDQFYDYLAELTKSANE